MKKGKLFMTLAVVAFATVGAFASKSAFIDTFYKQRISDGQCTIQALDPTCSKTVSATLCTITISGVTYTQKWSANAVPCELPIYKIVQ